MQTGPSRELFELWAPDSRNGLIITGYSVEGTLARVSGCFFWNPVPCRVFVACMYTKQWTSFMTIIVRVSGADFCPSLKCGLQHELILLAVFRTS
jgi:Cft2 family RNA processing exonuclease